MDHKPHSTRLRAPFLPALALAALLAGTVAPGAIAQTQIGPPLKLLKQEQPTPQPAGPAPASPARAAPAPDAGPAEEDTEAVEVQSLGAIDVSSAGLIDDAEGGLGADMWRGIARPLVERLLPRMPVATSSPAMGELARRLLLTRARVPQGAATVSSLLGLRVERLAAAETGGRQIGMLD